MVPSDVMVGRAKQHQDRQQNEQQFGKKAAAGPAALFFGVAERHLGAGWIRWFVSD